MLTLYSSPGLLSVVRGTVERLTEYLGFPITEARSITRAVDEALTNIVRHSYGNRPGQPITMYFRRARRRRQCEEVESGVEILLCDRGPAVDPRKFRGRPLEEIRPGGLGLYFIRQAMDIVEFSRKSATNRMRLVKYMARPRNACVSEKTL
jgi:anti-sigma regulatory factor (Ser/Thr protein kinase)